MSHRTLRSIALMAGMALVLGASLAGQTVKTTVQPGNDVSKYTKYAWRESRIVARQTAEVIARIDTSIRDAVNRQLAAKGYREDSQAPEFYVQVLGSGTPEMNTSANTNVARPGNAELWSSQSPNGMGVSLWMTVVSQISIIVTDKSTGSEMWRAEGAKKYKDPDKLLNKLDREIDGFMQKTLKEFPKRKQ